MGQLVKIAVEKGRQTRPDIKLGICGEHGGDPMRVEFCHMVGLNYVSCSPYRVPVARLAAAQAALKDKTAKPAAKKAAKKPLRRRRRRRSPRRPQRRGVGKTNAAQAANGHYRTAGPLGSAVLLLAASTAAATHAYPGTWVLKCAAGMVSFIGICQWPRGVLHRQR